MTSWTNVFGGSSVAPAQPSYSAISISANTALVWPLESTEGSPYVASTLDVTATTAGLSLAMPPGDTGSTGIATVITNVGSNSLTLTDTAGNAIQVIAPTVSYIITLTGNATTNGTWRSYQLGATVANATAAALAGPGLVANGSLLEAEWQATASLSANTLITASYRATPIVWTGAAGTLQLDLISNLGSGWYCAITNEGTAAVTISTSSPNTINGLGALTIQPGNSGVVIAGTSGFNSFGLLPTALSVANGGTGASTSGGALTNFGGTPIGTSIFTAANASAVISLLGLSTSLLNEQSVSTNQTVVSGSAGTMFVATAAITFSIPLTTSLTKSFLIGILADNGAVTITPEPTDTIAGESVGASYTLPSGASMMLVTDANGNWFPIFASLPLSSSGTYSISISGNAATATTANAVPWSGITGVPAICFNNGGTYGINVSGSAGSVAWGSISGKPYSFNQSTDVGSSPSFGGVAVTSTGISVTGSTPGSTSGWQLDPSGTGSFSGGMNVGVNVSGLDVLANRCIAASDRRIKRDIKRITADRAIDFVLDCPTYTYLKEGQPSAGWIAQEVSAAGFPHMIFGATDRRMRAGKGSPAGIKLHLDHDQALAHVSAALADALVRIAELERSLRPRRRKAARKKAA